MTSAGAVSAWRFLKRSPRYVVERWTAAAGIPRAGAAPSPIRTQTEADLEEAGARGLLDWQGPLVEDGPAPPFRAEAPMLKGGRPGLTASGGLGP